MIPSTLEEVVSNILKQFFHNQGIAVTATSRNRLLKVILESAEVPEPENITAFIFEEISKLKTTSLKKVKILAKQKSTFDVAWCREFEVESQVEPAIINEPEVETENHNSNKISAEEFQQALEESTRTAHNAYQKTFNYYKEITFILQNLKIDLARNKYDLLKQKDANNFNFAKVLRNIVYEIESHTNQGLQELKKYLEAKSKHLTDFTVVLFGRTKAGKSTIREALTCGDGSTIGKGSQRTTKDVREYKWKGLRLIDTPGIEAYQGEEDKQKAVEIVHESDIVIFLTSDDSVQPGEFDAIAWLQEIKKYFFVILNIKYDIDNPKRLERFIKNPEKIFDSQRLDEHKRHIRTYISHSLDIEEVAIIGIHAYAAFLSNQPQHSDIAKKLWQLSQIEEIYSLITSEIYTRGKQRRWNTFFDAVINFLDLIIEMLERHKKSLVSQADFLKDKRAEITSLFQESVKNGKIKIQRSCKDSFSKIKQWIPSFVDQYLGKQIAQSEYQNRMNEEKQKIETTMKNLFEEIVQELVASLNEFQRQYQYDMGTIKLESTNFGNYQQLQVGKILKLVSVGLGTASAVAVFIGAFAAASFLNPVGLIAGVTSIVVGYFSGIVGDREKKTWQKTKQEAKETLWKSLEQSEQETYKTYQKLLDTNIAVRAKTEVLEQVDIYIKGLLIIVANLEKAISQLEKIKKQLKRDLDFKEPSNRLSNSKNFKSYSSVIPDELL
ncbi:GTPase RsgA [Scytonema sp. UIC 10036]|uniref:GTPase n=1 Tax=Scytonema sp. UIC 10036 TaxID=2304196 RepID=UPI0012DABE96|nr:GTPase [Scytonema sp. UIC 10036]MUG94362.1 GTPase RsgA [Scytonema sp. UIC 10036]